MANEFPTLRQLAAITDNGDDKDHTPGPVSKKLVELGVNLDGGVDRYSCAKLAMGGWTDESGPYADPTLYSAITVTRALRSHRGYVVLEGETRSILFKCYGKEKKPEHIVSFGSSTPSTDAMVFQTGPLKEDWGEDTGIPAPWALVVRDDDCGNTTLADC